MRLAQRIVFSVCCCADSCFGFARQTGSLRVPLVGPSLCLHVPCPANLGVTRLVASRQSIWVLQDSACIVVSLRGQPASETPHWLSFAVTADPTVHAIMEPGAPQLLWIVVVGGEARKKRKLILVCLARLVCCRFLAPTPNTPHTGPKLLKCCLTGIVAWLMAYGIGANGELR